MTTAENNYKIDTTNYVAPDYGYAGLKYTKAKDNFDRSKIPGKWSKSCCESSCILEKRYWQWYK